MANDTSLAPERSAKTYRVGTLVYTQRALLTVLTWMLLGDFCLQLMEQLPTALVPLQLRWSNASDTTIGFLAGSLPAFLGIILNPFIGVRSDKHRGKLGRRRPFLLWSTPMVVLALAGLGFSHQAALALAAVCHGASVAAVEIGWICGCMMLFVVANTFVMQVYQFLFVDVIPQEIMGKFIGYYRAIGALGGAAFHRFFFGHAESHIQAVYLLAATLYAGSFLLLVWKVKEGEYPAPQAEEKSGRFRDIVKGYMRDCFGDSFYWKTYSLSLFFWSAGAPMAFAVFFGTKPGDGVSGYAPTLGMSLEEFGHMRSVAMLVSVPVYLAVGPIVDRLHPLRVALVGMFLSAVTYAACAFSPNAQMFRWLFTLNVAVQAVYLGAYLTLLPRLLPREKYGQFFTANQIFGFSGVVLAPVMCGWLIQTVRDYRFVFIWSGVLTMLGFGMGILLYRHWLRLGGDKVYRPPGSARREEAKSRA